MHLGSLYTALASFLHARSNQGKWLIRIDDSDTFRNKPGATESIIDILHCFGFDEDGEISFQSNNLDIYDSTVEQLLKKNLAYPCICTRKALASNKSSIYPGDCHHIRLKENQPHALRVKSKPTEINFEDELQGHFTHHLAQQSGDFIIKRKDAIVAYQLAVVIDDYQQNITHVVRGFDLLDSTPKQIFLQQILGYSTPTYCHVPIITDSNGCKLSKQAFAQPVTKENPQKTLVKLLQLLNQNPPVQLNTTSVREIMLWGIEHWNSNSLKKIRAIPNNISYG